MDIRVRQRLHLPAGATPAARLVTLLLAEEQLAEPEGKALLTHSGWPDDDQDLR
jgi:hypothetical protein